MEHTQWQQYLLMHLLLQSVHLPLHLADSEFVLASQGLQGRASRPSIKVNVISDLITWSVLPYDGIDNDIFLATYEP